MARKYVHNYVCIPFLLQEIYCLQVHTCIANDNTYILCTKYRLVTQPEDLRGFRNQSEADVSKPRRPEGAVPNQLRRWLIMASFIWICCKIDCGNLY